MPNELFLDASYAIALASASDQRHEQAVKLAQRLEAEQTKLVTTRAVVLEVGNALSLLRYRPAAIALIDALERDARVEIIPLDEPFCQQAWMLFRQRPDKEWGLTDCLSFVVMQDRGITEALSADHHFRQAGFRPLLLD
ncbi:MAG: type II toxin-antitoxin system VapC family toxin [Rhodothermales bacterium]